MPAFRSSALSPATPPPRASARWPEACRGLPSRRVSSLLLPIAWTTPPAANGQRTVSVSQVLRRASTRRGPVWFGRPAGRRPRPAPVARSGTRRERLAPGLRAHLREDALEARLGLGIDVAHRVRHGWVHGRDQAVHLVGDRAIGGMALAPGAKLDELHRLTRVQV